MIGPNDASGRLNSVVKNKEGALTYRFEPVMRFPIPWMSDKTYGIPAVPVKAKIKDGKKDTHSADVKSVFEEIQYIHRMIGVE